MRKLILPALVIVAASACAQTDEKISTLSAIKPLSNLNPISSLTMWADPTAVEYDGRLYVYGTNDQQEYDGNNGEGNNTYGKIKSLVVMSTKDMVNWTHHGTIDMAAVCGSWLWASWAPSIVSREEADGQTHFYMYFSNSGGGVGVVTSTSPVGPWTSPRSNNLVSGSTPGLGPCSWPFDPGVVIDDEGTGWLTLGGGEPVSGSQLLPGNAHIVKLGQDMVSLGGDFAHIPAPYQFEASELNMINGKYAYTYCSGWSDRNAWPQYGSSLPAPSTCSMCYMVSDNPMDPDSWVYGGEILANPGTFGYPTGNNHTHMHKFNGKYYLFYHTQVMENLAGITGGYRSIAVNEVEVDEQTVHIGRCTATDSGVAQIQENAPLATERQEAEMMNNAVGLKVQKVGAAGNTVLSDMQLGSWVYVKRVNFGDTPVTKFTARTKGSGAFEVRIDRLGKSAICKHEFSSSRFTVQTTELKTPITGYHNLYFVFGEVNNKAQMDYWQFEVDESEGISDIEMSTDVVFEEYYSLDGVRHDSPVHGINILRTVYADGSSTTEKVYR